MDLIRKYVAAAEELSRVDFAAHYCHPFLVKRANRDVDPRSMAEPTFRFTTQNLSVSEDPLAAVWQAVPVKKRNAVAGTDALSLGRSPTCDVVIRIPFVSKVHAYVRFDSAGKMLLRDNRGANGTYINYSRLSEGEERPLSLGDTVGLGSLQLQLVDAATFHDLLLGEVKQSS